ncbi:MAG: AMP-binding protein [Planctomycetota bacterium]
MLPEHDRVPFRALRANGDGRRGRVLRFPRASVSPSFAGDEVLHDLFEARADERPGAVAVEANGEVLSYVGLDRQANRLARHLRALGMRRGSRVAVLLGPSADGYAALLGILKAGAACVSLDPRDPPDRTAYVLEDSGAALLVTTTDFERRHAGFDLPVLRLDTVRDAIAAESPARLLRAEVRVDPNDLCHVFYKSAAAGRPTGVMIEHANACHLVRAAGGAFAMRPWDRVYQSSPLSWHASVQETWLAFHAGATLVAPTPRMLNGGRRLASHLSGARITVLPCAPSRLAMLTADVPSLRLVVLGGMCPEPLVARWSRADRRLVSTYGHAETTVAATYADLLPGRPPTLGRPLPGYRVYVLDQERRLVRYGEVGEICIGGPGVARGYLGLPVETEVRFAQDPFAPPGTADARIYLTGDLGRIDSTGNLEYHGAAPRPCPEASVGEGSRW